MVKTVKFWAAVNQNGKIVTFTDEPKRDKKTKTWKSKYPFINSLVFPQIVDLITKAKFTWESDPEFFEIKLNEI